MVVCPFLLVDEEGDMSPYLFQFCYSCLLYAYIFIIIIKHKLVIKFYHHMFVQFGKAFWNKCRIAWQRFVVMEQVRLEPAGKEKFVTDGSKH